MRVLVAPDAFKGTLSAADAAACLAAGWRDVRPEDEVALLPLADGGEGTLDALAAADPSFSRVPVPAVCGPCGARVDAEHLLRRDGTAVVELARSSGLPLAPRLDPLGATTRGVGEVLHAALRAGAARVVVAVGGSASTDGGAGLLRALGLRVLDAGGRDLPDGGGALRRAAALDSTGLLPPPPGGVVVLTDVRAPLLGPEGAAAVFGPQKGADAEQVRLLEGALGTWAALCGGDPDLPGAGAAGGTAYGLSALWGAVLVPGGAHVADLAGLDGALDRADLVVTGEGRFDRTSLGGKVCGEVLRRADRAGVPAAVVCGQRGAGLDGVRVLALDDLAGSVPLALADAAGWARRAGAVAAGRWGRPER